jgi:hypothetical protein
MRTGRRPPQPSGSVTVIEGDHGSVFFFHHEEIAQA